MAEVESAPVEVEQVEQAGESRDRRDNEPIVFDESLLIYVKGKVVQPKQPDHTESRLLIQKLQVEITKRGDRIKEIKSIEEQMRGSAKGASSGNKDIINNLKTLRDQRGTVIRQKQAIRDELQGCDATRESVRAEMRSIRDKNRNINPEKIEQDIKDLEFKLAHETLPDQEEKRVQAQLTQLTAARPLAKKYAEFDARLKETEAQRTGIMARLKESNDVIAQLDVQIAAANAVLDEAKAKADSHFADLPTLQARTAEGCRGRHGHTGGPQAGKGTAIGKAVEKKENYEIMVTLRAKIDELRKANDTEYQEYIKRDRAYRGWKRLDGRKKYEERQKAREQRDAERQDETKAIMGDIVAEPFSGEIFTCDQLLTYLRSFTAVKEEVKAEAKAVEVPAGLKPFKREEVVDEMFTGVPKKAAPPKKGAAAAAPAAKAAEPAKPKVQKLNHMLDMLKVFLQLQVEPPTTTSAIPATIEAVEKRKAEYKDKQEAAKRAPPPKPAAKEEPKEEAEPAKEEEPEAPAKEEPEANGKHEEEAAPSTSAPAEEEAAPAPAKEDSKPAEAAASGKKDKKAAKEEKKAEAAKEEAKVEAKAEAKPTAAAESSGSGVDVKLKVEGNKVHVTVRAA
ncbi:hypothetical protein HXX76_014957 [Chlamydomonas incerta]|uniref:Uncharacterized protein n=1 Tax=Chlamydomonas incerta TaxID=51695 RepID=A0A835SKA1_CHLIN|nr:hypothetical protein HXX76_014957 [Chlamydomonas incerta]|eukprot:KAG2423904.1 hypothetical protein HXX76_014957 [Chlamydomonas incerta]